MTGREIFFPERPIGHNIRHISSAAMHIIAGVASEGVRQVEEKEKREEDIDDMIFAGEEWHPSEK